MSFETGTTSLLVCTLRNPLPDNFLDRLSRASAGRLDEVKEEPVTGWVSGRHLLESDINEDTSICGGHLYVNLRKAERKIPAQLLNAICKKEELAYMQANDSLVVPRKEKKRIKEDAVERNLMKMPPVLSATPCVVDRLRNVLYLGTSSLKQFDNFVAEFMRVMGTDCEPIPMSADELMISLFKKTVADLPSLSFVSDADDGEPCPGRDFLTWLWYLSETSQGFLKHPEYGSFNIAIEGPLNFAYAGDKAKDPELAGAAESVVKKGNPLSSAEAKAALSGGKKLKKAKVLLGRGDADVWTFTFDADNFSFGSLALPEGEEMELNSRFEERIEYLNIFREVFSEYFKKFAESLFDKELANTEKKVRQWVKERESL